MNLKFCLFSFCFLVKIYLNEGFTFDELLDSIENKGLKQNLKNLNLDKKLDDLKDNLVSQKKHKSSKQYLTLAKNFSNELREIVKGNDWDKIPSLLTLGKKVLNACGVRGDDMENGVALQLIGGNWELFSNLFAIWNLKINSVSNSHNRRTKRAFKRQKEEEERMKKHNKLVDEFNQHVDEAYKSAVYCLIVSFIVMCFVVYFIATNFV
ncbi:unnamed protein product [Meloidogyne enterolobii]|uniref:Uncharacterized protein n=1 Tax=Meloidogyne enterolobii TaxID=390850 RepID=A0ACB0XUZ5_MELEN